MDLKLKLKGLIKQNPELGNLFSTIRKKDISAWLVGGCLRDLLLDLPVADIDLACVIDPTSLAKKWASQVRGHWFWLDSQRRQSRVLLKDGLVVDFSPIRASTIIEDLQLRDFTINSLAVPLDKSFPDTEILDPLSGLHHLDKKQLHPCSLQSFTDDPLRLLKGLRHAVVLELEISADTLSLIQLSVQLLVNVAGERIRVELEKILVSDNAIRGIELLIGTGLLETLLGPYNNSSCCWDIQAAINDLTELKVKIDEIERASKSGLLDSIRTESISRRALFLLAKLLKMYSPQNLPDLLHYRLRLSRYQQRLLEQLQWEPDVELYSLATSLGGQRCQALLVERLAPFSLEKMLYWGVCHDFLALEKVLELQGSFTAEQKFGRIPDLLDGRQIRLLKGVPDRQIGEWQMELKVAEITGEIANFQQAEDWLKSK